MAETLSRYQRVKNILNAAQGNVDVSYQGYGRFWDLPLEQFLAAEIYGVRLIATGADSDEGGDSSDCGCGEGCDCHADGGSCSCDSCDCCDPAEGAAGCSCETKDKGESGHTPGRGAASGLIKGLKGEYPFDGSQFPPLLWGPAATPVSASDIKFIQDWIDDGCPATDKDKTKEDEEKKHHKNLAYGHTAHPLTQKPVNAHKGSPGQLKVRKNIDNLSDEELRRFRAALAKMQALDKCYPQDERSFAYWAKMHADMCQHGWEQFLTWHRTYLYFFEQRLQDIDPTVTLPYWDWTQYAKQNQEAAAKVPPPPPNPPKNGDKQYADDAGIIPERYGCWMDDAGLDKLKGHIADATWEKLNKIKGNIYLSGNRLYVAAGITYGDERGNATADDDAIMNQLQRINPLWHRQRWPSVSTTLIPHYPTPGDVERVLQTPDFAHFGSGPSSNHFYGACETIHNYMHNFSGGFNPNYRIGQNPELYIEPMYGHMVENRVTAYDPIFWAHHCNVDRVFAMWQSQHPGVNPQVLDSPLPPFEMIVADTLSTADLGYEYAESVYHFETNPSQGLVRFRSEEVPVPQQVLQNHRRAEIRLHKVQVLQRGANIRVFVNQPEADANTPIQNNDHYIGNFTTFAGFCYGGPGHCDVPPETKRPYDHRMRHHKTPGNLRFDITEAVKKLQKDQNDTHLPLSVHLVVTDLHGHQREDLLKIDGVSIVFGH